MKAKIVLASVVSALLAGCGGGGDGAPGVAPVVAYASIFAEPLAAKCEGSGEGKVCDAPTSSGMSAAELAAVLTDPKAGSLKFKEYGVEFNIHAVVQRVGVERRMTATEGYAGYGGSEQAVVLSAGSIQLKGKSYAFRDTLFTRDYCATALDCILVTPFSHEPAQVTLIKLDSHDLTGGFVLDGKVQTEGKIWSSYVGLLTDRADVSVPAGESLKYSALVVAQAGDGSPVGVDQFNRGFVSCPFELTLNTRSGEIAAVEVSCTDERKGELKFSVPKLLIDKSRVRLLSSVDVVTTHASKIPTNDARVFGSSVPFTTGQVFGGVFGNNARELVFRGHGAQGGFIVQATRK